MLLGDLILEFLIILDVLVNFVRGSLEIGVEETILFLAPGITWLEGSLLEDVVDLAGLVILDHVATLQEAAFLRDCLEEGDLVVDGLLAGQGWRQLHVPLLRGMLLLGQVLLVLLQVGFTW